MLVGIKMKNICSGIRSQWPFENLRVDPKKITSARAFIKSISPKCLGIFG